MKYEAKMLWLNILQNIEGVCKLESQRKSSVFFGRSSFKFFRLSLKGLGDIVWNLREKKENDRNSHENIDVKGNEIEKWYEIKRENKILGQIV